MGLFFQTVPSFHTSTFIDIQSSPPVRTQHFLNELLVHVSFHMNQTSVQERKDSLTQFSHTHTHKKKKIPISIKLSGDNQRQKAADAQAESDREFALQQQQQQQRQQQLSHWMKTQG
ncbi:uncharacterized protein V6R79_019238 [Siganus canaliculatus]